MKHTSRFLTLFAGSCVFYLYYRMGINDSTQDKTEVRKKYEQVSSQHEIKEMKFEVNTSRSKLENCSRRNLKQIWEIPKITVTNCSRLFEGNNEEIHRAKYYLKTHRKHKISHVHLSERIERNCSVFLSDRKYISTPLNKEEEGFPIAFSIMVYKDMVQVERMFRLIYRPQNLYCFHVDSKSDRDFYRAMRAYTRFVSILDNYTV